MNESLIGKPLELAGYNLLITSEINMSSAEVYSAYHNPWRNEESFKIMKSQLDARPVYVQKENTITGHFLVCYVSFLLTHLLQFKVLGNQYCSEELFEFVRDFKVAKISEQRYIDLTKNSSFIKQLTDLTGLPITSYFLNNGEIKKMLNHRF